MVGAVDVEETVAVDDTLEDVEVLVLPVETETSKFSIRRSAEPVNGSVPVWIAWRYYRRHCVNNGISAKWDGLPV